MVADSLKMAVSQRLVKKVCPRCCIEEPVPSEQRLSELGVPPDWLAGVGGVRQKLGTKIRWQLHHRSSVAPRRFERLHLLDIDAQVSQGVLMALRTNPINLDRAV
jgi:hypothetical protein